MFVLTTTVMQQFLKKKKTPTNQFGKWEETGLLTGKPYIERKILQTLHRHAAEISIKP